MIIVGMSKENMGDFCRLDPKLLKLLVNIDWRIQKNTIIYKDTRAKALIFGVGRGTNTTVAAQSRKRPAGRSTQKENFHSVPRKGLEPPRPKGHRILNPARLPFRHPGLRLYYTSLSFEREGDRKRLYFSHKKFNLPGPG